MRVEGVCEGEDRIREDCVRKGKEGGKGKKGGREVTVDGSKSSVASKSSFSTRRPRPRTRERYLEVKINCVGHLSGNRTGGKVGREWGTKGNRGGKRVRFRIL